MNISLTPALERFILEKVASGRYASASEVVREALRVLQERERIEEARLKALRDEAARSLLAGGAPGGSLDRAAEVVAPPSIAGGKTNRPEEEA